MNNDSCILEDAKICNECQDCLVCDLDSKKTCNSCCDCLETEKNNKDYETIEIDKIIF